MVYAECIIEVNRVLDAAHLSHLHVTSDSAVLRRDPQETRAWLFIIHATGPSSSASPESVSSALIQIQIKE